MSCLTVSLTDSLRHFKLTLEVTRFAHYLYGRKSEYLPSLVQPVSGGWALRTVVKEQITTLIPSYNCA